MTGADSSGFGLQLEALENLASFNVTTHAAVMVSFASPENINAFRRRLREIRKDLEDFEVEELVLYERVQERLVKTGLLSDGAGKA